MDPQEGKGNEQDEVFPLEREFALAWFFLVFPLRMCAHARSREDGLPSEAFA